MTGIEIATLALAIAVVALVSILIWTTPAQPKQTKLSYRKRLRILSSMRDRIKAELSMKHETQELSELWAKNPELREDIEYYITFRNETFDVDYQINKNYGGEDDE